MSNQYITDTILAQQAGNAVRLSDVELKEITDRQHHVTVSITDRQRQLDIVIAMEKWYRKNELATARLEDATTHHNMVNKQYLAMRNDEQRLERFDAVQQFASLYEQIAERRRVIEQLKEHESQLAQSIEQRRAELNEAERSHSLAQDRLAATEEQFQLKQGVINNGYVLDGEIKVILASLIEAEDALDEAQRQQGEGEADYRNRQNEVARLKQQVETLSLHYQALSVHHQLFEQYQAVSDKLQLYNTESIFNDHAHQQFTLNSRRHSELLVLHDKTKKLLQNKKERLAALMADLNVHKAAIDELDSTALYHRYSHSQQRLVQLQSARTAWQVLCAGYDAIEAQRAALERMVRQLNQKRQEQEVVERDVKRLFERYNRLNKAFILLQIENTRKLREGLKEGTPCPVCGSAHHPYHTEVEQELGETQTQLERDYLNAKRDYEQQQVLASQVVEEAQTAAGQLDAERLVLQRMVEQQKLLETDWERFSRLDNSFILCSSSVNREARRTTIEMLIDSTNRHIEEYEQLISRYDFHNVQMRKISDEVSEADHAADEMQQQFWKLDTELQLVHERLETFRVMMAESDTRIEHLYKDLDDVVTLSGWRDENLDEFSKSAAELYNDWMLTSKNLERMQGQLEMLQYRQTTAEANCIRLQQQVDTCREERDRLREILASKREHLRKDFGTATPSEHAGTLRNGIIAAQDHCKDTHRSLIDLCQQISALQGRQAALSDMRQEQEERLRVIGSNLDHAIARFNLTHSPVQASELTAIFTDDRDWMLLRQTIGDCRDALLKAVERMQMAEKEFVELQNAPERPSASGDNDKPEALAQRHTNLVLELEALRGEQADIRRIIERHNQSH